MPSPLKPLLHMQEKLPTELVHEASAWQVCVPVEHSSISDERKIYASEVEQKKNEKGNQDQSFSVCTIVMLFLFSNTQDLLISYLV